MVVSNICLLSSLPGEMTQFDEHMFQMGWFNKVSALWVTFCYPRFVNLSGVFLSPRPRVPIRCCTSLCHRFGLHLGPGPSNFPGAISFRWPDLGVSWSPVVIDFVFGLHTICFNCRCRLIGRHFGHFAIQFSLAAAV